MAVSFVIELAIAYGFASLSIDRGNLWWYLLTLIFLVGAIKSLLRFIGSFYAMGKKDQELNLLKEEIIKNNVCPELKAGATQLVFGDGNRSSEIVFIGEAPGKNEDIKGLPFVGAAGKFLDEMLDQIGLKRSDVYITNIVKYRPPGNRDPLPDEKKAFLPYLRRQLEIIRPKLVVVLGRHSMSCFLPGMSISAVHGQPKRITIVGTDKSKEGLKVVIMPLFHPAAALYNGSMRQTLIDDFNLIPSVLATLSKQGNN